MNIHFHILKALFLTEKTKQLVLLFVRRVWDLDDAEELV